MLRSHYFAGNASPEMTVFGQKLVLLSKIVRIQLYFSTSLTYSSGHILFLPFFEKSVYLFFKRKKLWFFFFQWSLVPVSYRARENMFHIFHSFVKVNEIFHRHFQYPSFVLFHSWNPAAALNETNLLCHILKP